MAATGGYAKLLGTLAGVVNDGAIETPDLQSGSVP